MTLGSTKAVKNFKAEILEGMQDERGEPSPGSHLPIVDTANDKSYGREAEKLSRAFNRFSGSGKTKPQIQVPQRRTDPGQHPRLSPGNLES